MAKQLGTAGAGAYTCETAAHFWLLHVLARWEKFSAAVAQLKTADCVKVTPAPVACPEPCHRMRLRAVSGVDIGFRV